MLCICYRDCTATGAVECYRVHWGPLRIQRSVGCLIPGGCTIHRTGVVLRPVPSWSVVIASEGITSARRSRCRGHRAAIGCTHRCTASTATLPVKCHGIGVSGPLGIQHMPLGCGDNSLANDLLSCPISRWPPAIKQISHTVNKRQLPIYVTHSQALSRGVPCILSLTIKIYSIILEPGKTPGSCPWTPTIHHLHTYPPVPRRKRFFKISSIDNIRCKRVVRKHPFSSKILSRGNL